MAAPWGLVGFFWGMSLPWRGLSFLWERRRLWPLAAAPFLISFILYVGGIYLAWSWAYGWLEATLLDRAWGWRVLAYVLAIVLWGLMLIVAAVTFIPVATLVANPFNDLLSEKTERLYRGLAVDEPFSLRALFRALRVGLVGEMARALTTLALLTLALSLNLIPVAGQILSAAASAWIAIAFLSLEFTSFSMDRRLYTWGEKRAFLRRYRAATLGFGAMSFLIMIVPGVNALFIPVLAVAGTMLFCDAAGNEARPPGPPQGASGRLGGR